MLLYMWLFGFLQFFDNHGYIYIYMYIAGKQFFDFPSDHGDKSQKKWHDNRRGSVPVSDSRKWQQDCCGISKYIYNKIK